MKPKLMRWLVGTVAVMMLLPWMAVTFVKSNAGMAAILFLFFVIDPIYVIVAGFFAGRNMNALWSVPIIAASLFLLGTWIFFDMGERAFVLYAGVYLVMGIVSMLIAAWIGVKK